LAQCRTWWAWHWAGRRWQPRTTQVRSRAVRARHWAGDGPAEAAQVQLFAVGAEVDGADVDVAEQPEQFVAGEQAVPVTEQVGGFGAGQAGEGAGGRQDGDLGAAAALLGQVQSGAVGSVPQDLVQGVVPASAGAAGVAVGALALHEGVGDRVEQREGLRVQGAGQVSGAVRGVVGGDADSGVQPAAGLSGELGADRLGPQPELAGQPVGVGAECQLADCR